MHKISPYLFHARATLTLGLPLIGSHVAQFVLHLTDTVMLGWYGVLPLAAGVLGASSFFTIFVLGSGFAKAVMPMVASANSQGDERQVRRVATQHAPCGGLWHTAVAACGQWQRTEQSQCSKDTRRDKKRR